MTFKLNWLTVIPCPHSGESECLRVQTTRESVVRILKRVHNGGCWNHKNNKGKQTEAKKISVCSCGDNSVPFGGGLKHILVLFLEFEIKCPFLHFQKDKLGLCEKHQNQDTFFTSLSLLCLGVCLFVLGMGINIHSDYLLHQLRKPGEVIYKIPQGNVSLPLQIPSPPREHVLGIMW